MLFQDARIPVVFDPAAPEPDDVLFTEGVDFTPATGHAPGCACCAARSEAGRALAALLHARARGQVAFFRRVVVVCTTPEGRAEVVGALAGDPVVSVCFKEAVLFREKEPKSFCSLSGGAERCAPK